MPKLRLRLPSPALVISMVALSLVLGGTAFAAATATHKDKKADTKLIKKLAPSLSVKHAQTANSATTAANATHATSADSATNATNATHASSATTATNATHASSASTVTGQGTLASGQTEIGIIGGRFQNGANAPSPMAISTTFPLMAPVALDNAHIVVAPSTHCTGSTSNPTAAAGFVCIYPDITVFADTISGNTGVVGDTKLGFQMEWNALIANAQSSVRAEWAYTAP